MKSSSTSISPFDQTREGATGWPARLELVIARNGERSALVARKHTGPLLVQRPFHPEADGACHLLILHPPAGLVSGDSLELALHVRTGARTLGTTPAATKLYRARIGAGLARQRVHIVAENDAQVEWLPQESIAFSGCEAELSTHVELAAQARLLAWEILCLGRPASGERFDAGSLRQRWEVRREGRLLYVERFAVHGASPLLGASFSLRGEPVVGTFVAALAREARAAAEAVREALSERTFRGLVSTTSRGELVLTRYLGPSSEEARNAFELAWRTLRPSALGKPAIAPRIWKT